MENDKRKLLFGMAVLGLALLTSCQVVEPEKRAYPQVIGIDVAGEEEIIYVWLHMGFADGRYRTEQTKRRDAAGEGTVFYGFGCTGDPCRLRGNQRAISGYRACKGGGFWGESTGEQGHIQKSAERHGGREQSWEQSLYFYDGESRGTGRDGGRAGTFPGRFSDRAL